MIKLTRKIIFYAFLSYAIILIFLNFVGFWNQPSNNIKLPKNLIGKRTQVIGQIITPVYSFKRSKKIRLSFTIKHKKTKILIECFPPPNYKPRLGDIIQITGTIKKIDPHNKYTKRFKYHKIYYKINDYSINNYKYIGIGNHIFHILSKIRNYMLNNTLKLNKGLSKEIMPAILLGDKTYLSKNNKQLIHSLGVSHIIAISGMHVGFLYLFLFILFRKKHTVAFAISAFILLWSYAAITGFSSSCMRSATMFSLITIANLFDKKSLTLNNLIISAIIMLMVNPRQLFLVGFQLSFLGVFTIFYFYNFMQRIFNDLLIFMRLKKNKIIINYALELQRQNLILKILSKLKLKDIFLITLVIQIFLMPITLFYFQKINLTSIMFNLILVPFLPLMMLLGLSSSIFKLKFIAYINSFIINSLFRICKFLNVKFSYFLEIPEISKLTLVSLMCIMLFIPIIKKIAKKKIYIVLFCSWVGLYLLLLFYTLLI